MIFAAFNYLLNLYNILYVLILCTIIIIIAVVILGIILLALILPDGRSLIYNPNDIPPNPRPSICWNIIIEAGQRKYIHSIWGYKLRHGMWYRMPSSDNDWVCDCITNSPTYGYYCKARVYKRHTRNGTKVPWTI